MKKPIVERKFLFPFIIVTSLFALWGFANDITNPLVAAFQTVMEISNARASLIQFAFYGGYATMAIPAALFIQRFSYKSGILLGLSLYATGAFLFIPAANFESFTFFCVSLYILTFGLAFLETTANPFILSLGQKETATRRLNLAQAFNPIGSLMGMFVASQFILGNLISDRRDAAGDLIFPALSVAEKAQIRAHDLLLIRNPYVILGLVVLCVLVLFICSRIPKTAHGEGIRLGDSCKRLFSNTIYREGVVAQIFYVAAQIMCWTFIIQYAANLGINKATAQLYNIVAMGCFLSGRFIATFLMKFVNTGKLLLIFALGAMTATAGAILIEGYTGLICLVLISVFMSLMFPTIYGLALEDVGEDSTVGAAFLVMAIVGGSIMPPLQGWMIDRCHNWGLPSVNVSFLLPFICFVVIATFAYRTYKAKRKQAAA